MFAPALLHQANRLLSLDAYRGFVMLLMASEGLGFGAVSRSLPGNPFWEFLAYQTEHVAWVGCTLWDLVQPSFMFMVGVSLPFSIAARIEKGESWRKMFGHAIWRSLVLVALGIFLRSVGRKQTNFTFEDVLTQIGLGYIFLFLVAWKPPRLQAITAGAILFLYWLAFALFPLPPAGFDYASVGVPANWDYLKGFAAHWEKNTNLAAHFDVWFLNLFPREKPLEYNGGGYLTLNFIPSLATMIFGLLAGEWLRGGRHPMAKVKGLIGIGLAGLATGWALGFFGINPVVKRIWTPSWVIFSTGWCCLFLAFFYWTIDHARRRSWAFPLVVVGTNSIAMYVMANLWDRFVAENTRVHLGRDIFAVAGPTYAPIFQQLWVLLVLWLICYWLYRRKIFIKI